MRFPKGFPFYDSPWRQPITKKEQGHWFAPAEKVDLESTEIDLKGKSEKSKKIKKVIKILLILLGVATFLVLGYYFYKDSLELDFNQFKVYLH